MWINEQTLDVYRSHTEIRSAFPNVSFPPQITDEVVADFGVLPVHATTMPVIDYTQNASDGEPTFTGEYWEQTWVVTDASADEIAARTDAQWTAIRALRNTKLENCDWTQLPDAPLSNIEMQQWAAYRQALRDITTQADPFSIVWPEQPA